MTDCTLQQLEALLSAKMELVFNFDKYIGQESNYELMVELGVKIAESVIFALTLDRFGGLIGEVHIVLMETGVSGILPGFFDCLALIIVS